SRCRPDAGRSMANSWHSPASYQVRVSTFCRPSCPQPLGEAMEPRIPAALGFDLRNRRQDIIEVCPGSAMSLAHQMELALEIEAPRILRMAAIDHVEECGDLPGRVGGERDLSHGLAIDHGDLLARAQVCDRFVAPLGRDPIGDAAAAAAEVETEHEAGL